MDQIKIKYYKTSIGEMILGSYQGKLCLLDFRFRKMRKTIDDRLKRKLKAVFIEKEDELILKTIKQLHEYLHGKRKNFALPSIIVGTEFQQKVWNALMTIPYGKTASYRQIAKAIGKPKAVRAVANANGANAISIIIPCHRIIGSNGELVGYGGGLAVKECLLKLEQI